MSVKEEILARIAAKDPRYARFLSASGGVANTVCAHSGEILTTPDRIASGKGHSNRAWRYCLNPAPLLDPIVCYCLSCNSSCPKWEPRV